MTALSTVAVDEWNSSVNGEQVRVSPSSRLGVAVERAAQCLLARQKYDGHWIGELQGDTILETEYILLLAYLGREKEAVVEKAARYVLRQQLPDGGWSIYPGGPVELSATVKAYFALKLAGHDPDAEYMHRAREVILSHGGAAACNSFTKFYLAVLGQIPYESCPAVPPEMMFLPRWAYFNIYAMSAWTRSIVIPLTIFYAHKPLRRLSADKGIRELFVDTPPSPLKNRQSATRWLTWRNFFLALDRFIKWVDRGTEPTYWTRARRASLTPPRRTTAGLQFEEGRPSVHTVGGVGDPRRAPASLAPHVWTPLLRRVRQAAVRRAELWMCERFQDSDGLGAIFPPMIYTVIALRCLGYRDESPEVRYALQQLEDLIIEEDGAVRLQPCVSPVWDTALALNALADADLPGDHPAVERAVEWLLAKEVRRKGDWSLANPDLEPGGWFFEYRNGFYPDVDDTAMVLMALAKMRERGCRAARGEGAAAAQRGLNWLLAMQNKDGGWAAFDRDINREILTKVPFADHNAMLDPSCPDITARVLEALGYFGYRAGTRHVDRALDFIRQTQEPEGCWIGRWGVNYVYGTWQVLQGLQSIGFDMSAPMARKAIAWLKRTQQPTGAWGESCRSYDDPDLKGQGEPTASQTAWSLLGLIAAGEAASPEVHAGIDYLLSTQQADGSWHEDPFTGTGFPKVFYLKYHLYSLYFPLMALARFKRQEPEVRSVLTSDF